MRKEVFTLKFVPFKNCFVHLSPHKLNSLTGQSVLLGFKLECRGREFYASPSSQPCNGLDEAQIGLNSQYCGALGLKEGDIVVVSTLPNLGSVKRIKVSAVSDSDLEILTSSKDAVESQLLSQLRIVWPKQRFCTWVSTNISVVLVVDSLVPDICCGRLETYTEVDVDSFAQRTTQVQTGQNLSTEPSYLKYFTSADPLPQTNFELKCRSIPLTDSISKHYAINSLPYSVYVPQTVLPQSATTPILCQISVEDDSKRELVVEVNPMKDVETIPCKISPIFISLCVQRYLKVVMGQTVTLKSVKSDVKRKPLMGALVSPLFHVQVPEDKLKEEIKESLFSTILRHGSLLLNTKAEYPLSQNKFILLTLRPLDVNWGILDLVRLREFNISINQYLPEPEIEKTPDNSAVDKTFWEALVRSEKFVLPFAVVHSMTPDRHFKNNFLISGRSGTGKTTLISVIRHKLSSPPFFLFIAELNCYKLKGKRIEVLTKMINEKLRDCVTHQPSALIVENLHIITEMTDPEAKTEANLTINRIAFKMKELLEQSQRKNSISIIGTTSSTQGLHPKIYSPRGRSLFTTNILLPEFSKEDRIEFMAKLIQAKAPSTNLEEIDLNEAGVKTEGYVAVDIANLTRKALFEAWQRTVESDCSYKVTQKDLNLALDCTKPSTLNGIDLLKETKYSWDSVGGLAEAKAKLTEIIIWPSKFAHIMSQCPLKPQCGILLFGAPGTGKTILARAAARESSLNFITVKGPELLSKFIGQSEEGVRNIFEKARAAKPCLLFFDEFESLAPRRGADQTGVTDRVVNQLLTSLDGVDPLTGVFVVAATSRPDLIDPAILRPGRIGVSAHCPFPNKEERLAILKIIVSKLSMKYDLDLEEIASLTDGFSGADLSGLFTTAQIKLIDASISELDANGSNIAELQATLRDSTILNRDIIMATLEETMPSLSLDDKRRYEATYENFMKPTVPDISSQKVTFA